MTAQSKVWIKPDMDAGDLPDITIDVYPIPMESSMTSDIVGTPTVTKNGSLVPNVTASFAVSPSSYQDNGKITLTIDSSVNTAALLKTVLAALSGATVTLPAAADKDWDTATLVLPAFGTIGWPTLELKILKAGDAEIGANKARLLPANDTEGQAGAMTTISGAFTGDTAAAAGDFALICNGGNIFLLGKNTTDHINGNYSWSSMADVSSAYAWSYDSSNLVVEASKYNTAPVISINGSIMYGTDSYGYTHNTFFYMDYGPHWTVSNARCRIQIGVDGDGTVKAAETWWNWK